MGKEHSTRGREIVGKEKDIIGWPALSDRGRSTERYNFEGRLLKHKRGRRIGGRGPAGRENR